MQNALRASCPAEGKTSRRDLSPGSDLGSCHGSSQPLSLPWLQQQAPDQDGAGQLLLASWGWAHAGLQQGSRSLQQGAAWHRRAAQHVSVTPFLRLLHLYGALPSKAGQEMLPKTKGKALGIHCPSSAGCLKHGGISS